MPKMKTRRGAAKRFKVTGSGRIKRNKANHRHMLIRRSNKAKRQIVPYHDIVVIGKSSSRPKATMVPGAAITKLQKMQWSKQGFMPIAIDVSVNVCFADCGSPVSMRLAGSMGQHIQLL